MQRPIGAALSAIAIVALGGCTGAGSGRSSASPSASAAAPAPTSARAAAQLVLAQDPRFSGVGARDNNLIGQANWYQVASAGDGWNVTVRLGWGDCPAGCIGQHRWEFHVSRAGAVGQKGQSGDPLPFALSRGATGIWGVALAGPTCPVDRQPPLPGCAPRPVAGAVVVIQDAAGTQVASTTTRADGTFEVEVGPGAYRILPQAVPGMLGTAQPTEVTVQAGKATSGITLSYDTGIR